MIFSSGSRGGRCISPLDELLQYPGLAAPLADGQDTDYGDHDDKFDKGETSLLFHLKYLHLSVGDKGVDLGLENFNPEHFRG